MEDKGGDGGVLAARFFQQRNNAFPESRGRKGRGRWEVQEHGENAPACISRRIHANTQPLSIRMRAASFTYGEAALFTAYVKSLAQLG